MTRRLDRVEEACKEELSEIVHREVKDPRIGFITITRVKVSADLRHAKVYVSVMGDEEEVRRSIEGLNSAKGYLRAHLGKHLRLKYLPRIEFYRDEITGEAIRLTDMLSRLEEEEENRSGDTG